ncbi:MAG: hypothetical protein A2600_12590 [Candidatus Lambdaproteobacteria bacterium RIFOXYD1_FULL_56_27]|uniref:Uncharacterized protein n=1 Tax=Candidatus Lambdaproteobacteria bacterium RIFOXYD2_FULL_56_26 TaxID=1817773 RepID=A0A1F6GTV5_9PROT|nr:MAG: hypothetical protein A2426_12715 [Candidatus Lambdaproteobacteria bacterium RIFOXYC1_FULL_56_13]OGH01612.1 MAG: hypothetical protein A2557_00645 [Candidatus Lambdaproteobacteria bacterium RIFOXYD2_FULL_56_26]OGH07143.1 MAG: hypothetical protein A2600_12590 [Candidatus Lambdaproteobacteria bacterium RIFOXYD1_FULL_56_27]
MNCHKIILFIAGIILAGCSEASRYQEFLKKKDSAIFDYVKKSPIETVCINGRWNEVNCTKYYYIAAIKCCNAEKLDFFRPLLAEKKLSNRELEDIVTGLWGTFDFNYFSKTYSIPGNVSTPERNALKELLLLLISADKDKRYSNDLLTMATTFGDQILISDMVALAWNTNNSFSERNLYRCDWYWVSFSEQLFSELVKQVSTGKSLPQNDNFTDSLLECPSYLKKEQISRVGTLFDLYAEHGIRIDSTILFGAHTTGESIAHAIGSNSKLWKPNDLAAFAAEIGTPKAQVSRLLFEQNDFKIRILHSFSGGKEDASVYENFEENAEKYELFHEADIRANSKKISSSEDGRSLEYTFSCKEYLGRKVSLFVIADVGWVSPVEAFYDICNPEHYKASISCHTEITEGRNNVIGDSGKMGCE